MIAMNTGKLDKSFNKLPASIRHVRPPHICRFVGRSSVIERLVDAVKDDEEYCCCIYGLPGVGKTRLAIELAHDVRDLGPDWSVVYVSAVGLTSSAMLESDIYSAVFLYKTLKPETERLDEMKRQFQSIIAKTDNKFLLILDGCDKILKNSQERQRFVKLLDSMVTAGRRDFTIVTTSCSRYRLTDTDPFIIRIDPLELNDSMQLLQKYCSNCSNQPTEEEAREICTKGGGLPVYLEAVGSILVQQKDVVSPTELLKYMTQTENPIETLDQHRQYDKPSNVFTALFEVMQPDIKEVFMCLSLFCNPFSKEEAASFCDMKECKISGILASLNDFALLRKQPDGKFTLHQLIHQFAFQQASNADSVLVGKCQQQLAACHTASDIN